MHHAEYGAERDICLNKCFILKFNCVFVIIRVKGNNISNAQAKFKSLSTGYFNSKCILTRMKI